MKKVICFIVCCIAMLAVTSCGEKTVKGANGKEYETYQQAVRNQDFEAAYIFLDRIENDEGKDNDKYITARDFIVGHELTYLASVNSEESSKRIIYLLTEMRPEANKIPIGEIDLHLYSHLTGGNPEKERIDAYSLEVNNFNKQCNRILDLAITEKNEELAQGVLKCYVPSIIVGRSMKERSSGGVDHEIYNISYNNEDYEQADKKINEFKWDL